MDIKNLTIKSARELLDKKEITGEELGRNFLELIAKENPKLNAYLSVFKDEDLKPGNTGHVLSGIPGAIKDNILIEGKKCTGASKILENYVAAYDATVIKKLKQAGSVFLGKTNLDEFAMGTTSENSAFGPSLNPHDLGRPAGGSSGGSASAVAGGLALYALGSDTGGSIRDPASFCGVVGLKPTYGAVSRYGLMAMASSLDQIGPITKNVEDAAIVLGAIAGKDPLDSTSALTEVPDYTASLNKSVKGLRLGIPKEFFGKGLDPRVGDAVQKAIAKLESLGAHVDEVSLPYTDYALAAYYIIVPSEVSANLARYDGIKYGYSANGKEGGLLDVYLKTRAEGFGEEVRRRIMIGTYALSAGYYDAYYLKAQKVRALIKENFNKIFENFDAIVGPTMPTPAPKLGELDNPLAMYMADIYTVQINIAGLPAISVPCGFAEADGVKLPVGLQIIGKHFDEEKILRIAHAYEQNK